MSEVTVREDVVTTVVATPPYEGVAVTPETDRVVATTVSESGMPDVVHVLIPGGVGPQGPEGPPGSPQWSGVGPPPGVIVGAQPGDVYLDVATGDLYFLE